GAEHVERAVGEVHDVEHAEDQREADGEQEQQHAVGQPVQRLGEEISRHGRTIRGRDGGAWGRTSCARPGAGPGGGANARRVLYRARELVPPSGPPLTTAPTLRRA